MSYNQCVCVSWINKCPKGEPDAEGGAKARNNKSRTENSQNSRLVIEDVTYQVHIRNVNSVAVNSKNPEKIEIEYPVIRIVENYAKY